MELLVSVIVIINYCDRENVTVSYCFTKITLVVFLVLNQRTSYS